MLEGYYSINNRKEQVVNISKPIFLDNQSTTPLDQRVFEMMVPYFKDEFGNPHSSHHVYGRTASTAIEAARKKIANCLNTNYQDIYFTSGATESNNLLIKGLGNYSTVEPKRIITVKSEHKCVLQSCQRLEEKGFDVVYLNVGTDGLINLQDLEQELTTPSLLTTIMFVNNETGVIQPVEEIGQLCKKYNSFFHTDAAQAAGKINIDCHAMNIDALSISGHKLYGPKGVGILYVNAEVRKKMQPLFDGGGQEKELRSGTLPTPLCVGLGEAIDLAINEKDKTNSSIKYLRDSFLSLLKDEIQDIKINGTLDKRIEGNLNICIPGVSAEALINNMPDLAISTGSACTSGFVEKSHVLSSMAINGEDLNCSFRISIGKNNTIEEMRLASSMIINATKKLKEN